MAHALAADNISQGTGPAFRLFYQPLDLSWRSEDSSVHVNLGGHPRQECIVSFSDHGLSGLAAIFRDRQILLFHRLFLIDSPVNPK
jgi:hypothetical protein